MWKEKPIKKLILFYLNFPARLSPLPQPSLPPPEPVDYQNIQKKQESPA
jgi:hypothetical protein